MPALKWVSRITCLQNHTNSSPVFIKPFFFLFRRQTRPCSRRASVFGSTGWAGFGRTEGRSHRNNLTEGQASDVVGELRTPSLEGRQKNVDASTSDRESIIFHFSAVPCLSAKTHFEGMDVAIHVPVHISQFPERRTRPSSIMFSMCLPMPINRQKLLYPPISTV